ncbi:MAG: response regulator, partial [Rubrivivax sp.]|nr:response regulator [Rubrivivax sp.]
MAKRLKKIDTNPILSVVKIRILFVDDEPDLPRLFATLIQRLKPEWNVKVAHSGKEALAVAAQQPFDVVVSDIVLPGTSGLELAKRIRELDSLAQVILMTGVPSVESAAQAVRSGVFDYLLKPVNRSAIVRVVGNAARLRAVQEERARLFEENQRYQADLERLVRERTAALEAEIAERMRTEEALRRAVERVEGLQKIDRAILRADSPDRIIFRAIRHLRRMLGCPVVAVAVFEAPGNAVNIVRSCKENGETLISSVRVPRADFPVPEEIAAGTAYQASEPPGEAAPWEEILLGQGLRVWLTLPLLAEGSVLGLLSVGRNGHVPAGAEAAEVAREAADQLSIGLFQARLRETIRAHTEQLESQVAERTADLARANRELQAASQAKSEFLASMSHELR